MLAINRYDEYGIPQSTNAGRFQYTGQAWLPELGLYYYKARMYSPTLGRFMQTDPIGYGDGLNWYAYAGNDPVNGRDPSGTEDLSSITTVEGIRYKPYLPDFPLSMTFGGAPKFKDLFGGYEGNDRGGDTGDDKNQDGEKPPCPTPSASAMQAIVSDALQSSPGGGKASNYTTGYATLSQRPNVQNSPGSLGQGWYAVSNSHGPNTQSYQYDLGTSGYSVKVYFNDGKNGGRDTAAIVSTNSIAHAMDAAAVILGIVNNNLMNYNLGVAYMREVGICK